MHANVLPFYTPLTPVWGQKVKKNSEEGCFAYHIMQLKCLTLCTPLALWIGLKSQTLKLCRLV